MFKRIFIKRNETDKKGVDIGKISECLLFYGKTDILVDKFLVQSLCENIDIGIIKEFSKEGLLNIWIRQNVITVAKFETHIGETYSPMVTGSDALNLDKEIFDIYFRLTNENKGKAKKLRRILLQNSQDFKYSTNLTDIFIEEWKDKKLLSATMRTYLNQFLPQLDTNDVELEIVDEVKAQGIFDSFKMKCNLDLDKINEKYKELLPTNFQFSSYDMLLRMVETRGDLDISSTYASELYSDVKNEPFIENRFQDLYKKIHKSDSDIKLFQDVVLENYKPINETLRSGEKTFSEYSEIIRKSVKFRKWLDNLESDESLLSQYYNEVTKDTWINKKPVKAARLAIFGTAGFLGNLAAGGIPIGTLLSSTADKFLVDPLLKGWKPNQFIDGEVKGFLPKQE